MTGNEAIELRITDLSSSGAGVGHHDGQAVFVSGAIPGDFVKVLIQKTSRRYKQGRVIQLISSSPQRIQPKCAVANRCGGCSLQHMDYQAQLQWKKSHLEESLVRIGGFDKEMVQRITQDIVFPLNPWHYRNKVILPVGGTPDNPKIGFYEFGTHHIVDAAECIVQFPFADTVREFFRQKIKSGIITPYDESTQTGYLRYIMIRAGVTTSQVMIVCVTAEDKPCRLSGFHSELSEMARKEGLALTAFFANYNYKSHNTVLGERFIPLHGAGWIEEIIQGIRFRISPEAFFQVHTAMADRMFREVITLAALEGHETVMDLYCGTGSMTLLLAGYCTNILGVEVSERAIADARINAMNNAIANATFYDGKSEEILPRLVQQGLKADLIVMDPPRKGAEKEVLDSIKAIRVKKILYISCDPATLARDLKLLCSDGEYYINCAIPFDLFPWTSHVETVVLMSRSDEQYS